MTGDNDKLQGLFKGIGTAERGNRTIKSTLDRLDQAIERMLLKID